MVTGKEFMNAVAHGERDVAQLLLDILSETEAAHCAVGELAVNTYADPVVSPDPADIVRLVETDGISARRLRPEMRGAIEYRHRRQCQPRQGPAGALLILADF
jgi:hypothetical protein